MLSVVEVCADYDGVNVLHFCLNFDGVYGVGVCGVVCVLYFFLSSFVSMSVV